MIDIRAQISRERPHQKSGAKVASDAISEAYSCRWEKSLPMAAA